MPTTAPPATSADVLDPTFWGDLDAMHATFRALRAEGPVARDERNGLWLVLGHPEAVEVERRSDVFVSGLGYRSFPAPGEDNMIALDDPRHAEQRKLVSRRFTPKAVRELEPYLTGVIEELLAAVLPVGSLEVVSQLAAPLPARLTAHLLGFPEDRWHDIQTWSERLMRYDQAATDMDAQVGFMQAIIEFEAVLREVAEARRAEPADDLITTWTQASVGGCPMSHDTLINETGLVISGGAETTRTVISRGLAELAAHPDQWEAMAADPGLVPGAVEELIRWVSPLNNFFRTAVADATIGDHAVRAGDRVMLVYPSANRDERVFTDPDVLDVRRAPNPHIAFGFGAHFCLGASLARFELGLLFRRLTGAITDLTVLSPPDIEDNVFVGAVRSLELGFRTR